MHSRRIPGVSSAAATTDPELTGDSNSNDFSIQGYKPAEEENMNFESPRITPATSPRCASPLLVGREFTAADVKGQPKVAVVNLAFAKRSSARRRMRSAAMIAEGSGPMSKPDTTIVGVVGNIRHTDLRTELGAAVYRPYLQMDHPNGVAGLRSH